jgi:hypothetical protein
MITISTEMGHKFGPLVLKFSSRQSYFSGQGISLNNLILILESQIQFFSENFYSAVSHLSDFVQSNLLSDDVLSISQILLARKEKNQIPFDFPISNYDSSSLLTDIFTQVRSNIQEINQKSNFFFQQEYSFPQKIQSLTKYILLYLDQFDENRKRKFHQLYQLFGIGIKPEFPMNPSAFVQFIDSISDKIIQLHDKSNRNEREFKSLKEIIEREKVLHSNILVVLNNQNERRISLIQKLCDQ